MLVNRERRARVIERLDQVIETAIARCMKHATHVTAGSGTDEQLEHAIELDVVRIASEHLEYAMDDFWLAHRQQLIEHVAPALCAHVRDRVGERGSTLAVAGEQRGDRGLGLGRERRIVDETDRSSGTNSRIRVVERRDPLFAICGDAARRGECRCLEIEIGMLE